MRSRLSISLLTVTGLFAVSGILIQCGDSSPVSGGSKSPGLPWHQLNPHPTSEYLHAVEFLDGSIAYAVGNNGTVLRSVDGGRTWKEDADFPATATDLTFVDEELGWAVGGHGMIMHTFNGGRTWSAQKSGTTTMLRGVTFIDQRNGWAIGFSGLILATDDGGNTWTKQRETGEGYLMDILFVSDETGWAIGTNYLRATGAEVLYTNDGGQNWVYRDVGIPVILNHPDDRLLASLNAIAAADHHSITIVGEAYHWGTIQGIRLHTRDGGDNWSTDLTSAPGYTIHYATPRQGWMAGMGGILYRTQTAGLFWERQETTVGYSITSINFADSLVGCAVGSTGTVLTTENGGETWEKITAGSRSFINDIQFADRMNGWVAGFGGVLRTIDGGVNWVQTDCSANMGLYFLNADEGWACDYSGNLDKTMDGGITWSRVRDAVESRVYDMVFFDSLQGWVCGMPAILVTENGGYNWTVKWAGGGTRLFGLSFINPERGWVVGDHGTVLHTRDGGDTWIQQDCPTEATLEDVHFVDSLQGWAVGGTSAIFVTSDGGENWSIQVKRPELEFGALSSVAFIDALTGWVAGDNGVVLATIDGGLSWHSQNTETSMHLWALSALDHQYVWTAGWSGAIFHTTTGGW